MICKDMDMFLNVEELLSVNDFQETGSTDQLLIPDLTNLSQGIVSNQITCTLCKLGNGKGSVPIWKGFKLNNRD